MKINYLKILDYVILLLAILGFFFSIISLIGISALQDYTKNRINEVNNSLSQSQKDMLNKLDANKLTTGDFISLRYEIIKEVNQTIERKTELEMEVMQSDIEELIDRINELEDRVEDVENNNS